MKNWLDKYDDGGTIPSFPVSANASLTHVDNPCGPGYVLTTDAQGNDICVNPASIQREGSDYGQQLREASQGTPTYVGSSWDVNRDGPYPSLKPSMPLETYSEVICPECSKQEKRNITKSLKKDKSINRDYNNTYDRFSNKKQSYYKHRTPNQGLGIGRFFNNLIERCLPGEDCFQFEDGGPIKVTDPNDPRLIAYNDSSNLYKAMVMQDKLMGPGNKKYSHTTFKWNSKELKEDRIPKKIEGFDELIARDFQNEKEMFEKEGIWARPEDKKLIKYYKSLGFKDDQIMYHSSPDIVSDKIKAIGTYYDGFAASPVYKKPVQPYEYQPSEGEQFIEGNAILGSGQDFRHQPGGIFYSPPPNVPTHPVHPNMNKIPMRGMPQVGSRIEGALQLPLKDSYDFDPKGFGAGQGAYIKTDKKGNKRQLTEGEYYQMKNSRMSLPMYGKYQEGGEITSDLDKNYVSNSREFLKGWYNSPKYKEMLAASVSNKKNPIKEARLINEDRLYGLSVPVKTIPDLRKKQGAFGLNDITTNQIFLDKGFIKENPGLASSLVSHELSHNAYIPKSDIAKIKSFTPAYDPKIHHTSIMKNDPKENYNSLTDPEEVRAMIYGLRNLSKGNNIYDPFTEPATKEHLQQLAPLFQNTESGRSYDQLNRLKTYYTEEQIIDMMNTISENKNVNQNPPMAKHGGPIKYTDVANKYFNAYHEGFNEDDLVPMFQKEYGLDEETALQYARWIHQNPLTRRDTQFLQNQPFNKSYNPPYPPSQGKYKLDTNLNSKQPVVYDEYQTGGPVNTNTSWFNQELVQKANERMAAPSTTTLGKVIPKTGAKDTRAKYIAKNPGSYNIEDYKQGHQEPGAEPIPLEAMLLPGTPVIKGLGKLGNFALDAVNPFQGMRNINKVAPHLSANAKSALSHDAASPIIFNAGTSAMGGIMPVMNEAIFGNGDADPEELVKNIGYGAGLGYLAGNMFRNKQVKNHYKNHKEYYNNYDKNRQKWANELFSLKAIEKANQQAIKEGVTNQPDMWGFKRAERQAIFDAQTAKDLARIEQLQSVDRYNINPNIIDYKKLYNETRLTEDIANTLASKDALNPDAFWIDYRKKDYPAGTMHNIDNATSKQLEQTEKFFSNIHNRKYYKYPHQQNKYGGVVKMADGGIVDYSLGSYVKDSGKLLLNTVASPLEQISGNNFVNFEYDNKGMADAAAVSEGVLGAATDVVGSYFLGPAYGMAKSTIQPMTSQIGHSTEYQKGANKWANQTGQIASSVGNLTSGIMSGNAQQIVGGSGQLLGTLGKEFDSKELAISGQVVGSASQFVGQGKSSGDSSSMTGAGDMVSSAGTQSAKHGGVVKLRKSSSVNWLDKYEEGGETKAQVGIPSVTTANQQAIQNAGTPYLNRTMVQAILANASQPVTNTLEQVISTPESREKERREKVIANDPSQYSVMPGFQSDYNLGIQEPGADNSVLADPIAMASALTAGGVGLGATALSQVPRMFLGNLASEATVGLTDVGKYLTRNTALKNAYKLNPSQLPGSPNAVSTVDDVFPITLTTPNSGYKFPKVSPDAKSIAIHEGNKFVDANWKARNNIETFFKNNNIDVATLPQSKMVSSKVGYDYVLPEGVTHDMLNEYARLHHSKFPISEEFKQVGETIRKLNPDAKINPISSHSIHGVASNIHPDFNGKLGQGLKVTKQLPGSPNVVSSVDDVIKQPWQMEELSGLHLKSTMEGQAISKIVEPKTGLVNTEQALAIIGKESNGAEKVALIRKGLGENLPQKMDYNEFRKTVQEQLIPLERQFRYGKSDYGIDKIGYKSFNSPEQILENGKWVDNPLNKNIPLENQTLILGNKGKFGVGSSAHGNPEETLGHIHFLRDAETPDVLTVTQIQSDAFQGTHRIMPKNAPDVSKTQQQIERLKTTVEENKRIINEYKTNKIDGSGHTVHKSQIDQLEDITRKQEQDILFKEADLKNLPQKQLLDKNHQERYLQELVDYAGKRGDVNKVRVPTSETAAKVQGYSPIQESTLGPKTKKQLDESSTFEDFFALKKDEIGDYKLNNEEFNAIKKIYTDYKTGNLGKVYDPAHTTILKKYSEQPKTIKKLFGVEPKVVTDSKGNTWYEFDIPESFKQGKGQIKAFGLAPTVLGAGALGKFISDNKSNPEQTYGKGGSVNNNWLDKYN